MKLRLVICGGEALELQSLRPWFARHGDRTPQLVNMYGITETTVHVTYRPLTAADLELTASSVIGRALAYLQVYLLDGRGQPVPIGVAGEICVGGTGLARGYLNRAELTAERFVPHPFSTTAGARLYKSGDLARFLANGDIEYLDRIDQQVKVRGFRIELGEIEAVLTSHASVREAVVVMKEDKSGDKCLACYIVAEPEAQPDIKELRLYLRNRLPDYMIPTAFMMLESLPLNPRGKVDRRALPAPDVLRPELDTSYVVPQTEAERNIAEVWQEVLQLEFVGILDNFFDLGGHSLLMVQVHDKLRERFKFEVSLVELFEYPSINSLAEYLSRQKNVTTIQDDNLVLATKLREGKNRLQHQRATRA